MTEDFFFFFSQFSLLAEAISQERQELKAREKSQAQVITGQELFLKGNRKCYCNFKRMEKMSKRTHLFSKIPDGL